jgi:anti-sigma regulatory factor (Ser/Thr protein kinase)
MAHELTALKPLEPVTIRVSRPAEAKRAGDTARSFASSLGFPEIDCDEITLVVAELASNIIKHAGGGSIELSPTEGRAGIRIASEDSGPGISDVERALTDGFSTAGSRGVGLGAVNRLMHELIFDSHTPVGTRIVCQRWLRPNPAPPLVRWMEFGAATRAFQRQPENGDAFIIRQWEGNALAGVIDGLGHGEFARRASQTARQYIEQHFDQSMDGLFRGVGRACRATRGVVMTLAHFDIARQTVTIASVGNVEVRLIGGAGKFNPAIRRGIIGLNAPNPAPTQHPWTPDCLLIIHSDGLRTRWQANEFPDLTREAPGVIAQRLLHALGKMEDDATVVVGRSAQP